MARYFDAKRPLRYLNEDFANTTTSLDISATLAPTGGGLAMVTFLTGLDADGDFALSEPNYWNWLGDNPATYGTAGPGFAHQWVPGSTVTYWFDSQNGGWTASEQTAITQALNLWSAIANIHFSQSTAPSAPSDAIKIARGAASVTTTPYSYNASLDMLVISGASATIGMGTPVASFSTAGSAGRQTVMHELGHALGLGHAGPYNGTAAASQVRYTEDTRQYTVMSYVDAGSATAAAVAASNGDAPSAADYTNHNGTFSLVTPGQFDILAIQRLYGAATNSPLTVSQTFGFNAGPALKAALPQYDFTVNTNPVVTLWNSASGNILDLSGFALPSTVDLNPGAFSSANGMIDNIGIAFDTWIDAAVGGAGNDTFYDNAHANSIEGGPGANTVVYAGKRADYVLWADAGSVTVTASGITDTLSNIQTLTFDDQSIDAHSIACFVQGARILTPAGEVAVECLAAGTAVVTAAGRAEPIKWIGHRTIDLRRHPHPPAVAPIRITRGAFGTGRPRRDLLLSPDHSVLVQGMLIPAGLLTNGCTIVQETQAAAVTYLHVELARHEVLLAEGLTVESYLDTGNRAMFANGGEALLLHPDCSPRCGLQRWERDACAPLVTEGEALHRMRSLLLQRALALGYATADDPHLGLAVDGRELSPVATHGQRHVFALPQTRRFHILSRSAVPMERGPHGTDRRRLGVAIARIRVNAGEIPIDHPGLRHGWHAVEAHDNLRFRWTDGAAQVVLPEPMPAGGLVTLLLCHRLARYPVPLRTAA